MVLRPMIRMKPVLGAGIDKSLRWIAGSGQRGAHALDGRQRYGHALATVATEDRRAQRAANVARAGAAPRDATLRAGP
jgi:hypothetical protein